MESLFNKVAGLKACNLLKRDSNTSVLFCEIFKNTYFEEHLRTTACRSHCEESFSEEYLWELPQLEIQLIFQSMSSLDQTMYNESKNLEIK